MKRVLIVEDEVWMAGMLARVLREEGYAPETAADGREGFARAADDSFDLLILDWMLPDRSGVRILRGLRAAGVDTPVLMLTARDQVEDRVEGPGRGRGRLPAQTLRPLRATRARTGPDQEAGEARGSGRGGAQGRRPGP